MFGFRIKRKKPEQEEPQAGVVDPNASYEETPLGQARYAVEQKFVPEFFFSNPTGFIDAFTEEYGFHILYAEAYRAHCRKKIPYWDTDFPIDVKKLDSGDYLALGELPIPEYKGLCYRMYFLFDTTFEHLALFMVERGEDGPELYQWNDEKTRRLLEPVEVGPWKEKTKEQKEAELDLVTSAFAAISGHYPPAPSDESAADAPVSAPEDEASGDAPASAPEDVASLDTPAADSEDVVSPDVSKDATQACHPEEQSEGAK